ncbi:MAG TPA: hypothetical protein ENH75_03135 [archaeon]|nr:hypothetical protein [archaeon]
MGSGGKALGIIGLILGAGAIVFVVWNGQNTTNSDLDGLNDEFNNLESDLNNLSRIIVVGIWNAFDENQDFAPHTYQNDWFFEFLDNKLNNTDYISVSNNNTRITLLKSGWYRIHLSVLLAGLGPSNIYLITIFKDGAIEFQLERYETGTSSVGYYNIYSSAFVYSNGTNYIEINGLATANFYVSLDVYSQLTIEYVVI